MVTIAMRGRLSQMLCWVGSGAAALYFGTQVVVGLMTDDYSFLRDTASELGQRGAPHAGLFAVGAVSTGIATLAAALGVILASKPSRTRRVAGAITLASAGIASVAAGVYPLPDSRHGGGAIGAGLFLLPFVSIAVAWPIAHTWARTALVVGAVWFVVAGVVMSGATPIDQKTYEGICQRFLALPTFGAISLTAYLLTRSPRPRGNDVEVTNAK
jgi:hypothetical membrane protein